jgi:hypothetical protein
MAKLKQPNKYNGYSCILLFYLFYFWYAADTVSSYIEYGSSVKYRCNLASHLSQCIRTWVQDIIAVMDKVVNVDRAALTTRRQFRGRLTG